MSTLEGHSVLQALHEMQRSITSYVSFEAKSFGSKTFPASALRNALALARVVSCSSLVAMYDGHIVPALSFRQTAAPLHISTAAMKPPSLEKSRWVLISMGL